VQLARSATRIAQLAETFGMTQASISSWLKQDRIDRGETPGLSRGFRIPIKAVTAWFGVGAGCLYGAAFE
jgi:hypothetical protein